eukprot:TRINITY_DN5466_c0_g1_i1.p1 TRINITY_DN5466_c0_g1~~TRINITY_DN5466_c0_g1_i1.p1  ORF type:complete len:529 (-),score=67.31 TRINITY_DN5466_c0_g1_i1:858-2444(-)
MDDNFRTKKLKHDADLVIEQPESPESPLPLLPVVHISRSSPRTAQTVRSLLWLKIMATYLVSIYHTVRFFDNFPSDISLGSAQTEWYFEVFSRFVTQWHMPLFFVMAGFSQRISFGRGRGAADVMSERFWRLFVPFASCLFLIVVPQMFLVQVYRNGWANVAFFPFAADFFVNHFTWSHLWFLVVLLAFTALHFPFFWYLLPREQLNWTFGRAVACSLFFLACPILGSRHPAFAGFFVFIALCVCTIAYMRDATEGDMVLTASVMLYLSVFVVFMSHYIHFQTLGLYWGLFYSCLLSCAALQPHLPVRLAGALAVLALCFVAVFEVTLIATPSTLPLPSTVGVLFGYSVGDAGIMVAHYCAFYIVGFAAACWATSIAAAFSALIPYMGFGLLMSLPLITITLPQRDGYMMLVGNYPTYLSQMSRAVFHVGSWLWVAMLLGLARFLTMDQTLSEAVERYLGRFTITLYATHTLWAYVWVFPVSAMIEYAPLVRWFPVVLLNALGVVTAHAFHHFIILRFRIPQILIGFK